MDYFVHITNNNIDGIYTYRKSDYYQADDISLFADYPKIITISECDGYDEAVKRLMAALEDGEFLSQCEPEPTIEQVEELYKKSQQILLNQ